MKICKKIISLALSVFIVVSILPLNIIADAVIASGQDGNINWNIDDNGVLTITGTGSMNDKTASEFGISDSVKAIITSVVIKDGITDVSPYFLHGASTIKNLTIADSVEEIGDYAFSGCYLLKDVTLGKSLKSLGTMAFGYTAIESITIPKSLTCDCGSGGWYSYTVEDEEYQIYCGPFGMCEKLKNVTFETGITKIASSLFEGCVGLENITIPDTVTEIGSYVFRYCLKLENVTIGNSVVNIDDSVFAKCISLTEIAIPDSVEEIGNYAFSECYLLKDVTLGKSLKSLGTMAFGYTAIESITIPKSLTCDCGSGGWYSYTVEDEEYQIYCGPFGMCEKLKNVTFETGITKIASSLFEGCVGLENITIPDTVTEIGSYVFRYCLKLENVTIGNSVVNIDDSVFAKCISLTEIAIPDSVEEIGDYAFNDCLKLENIKLPKYIIVINRGTFYNCDSLKTIEIPTCVRYIYSEAFRDCDLLKNITFENNESNLKEISSDAFYDCKSYNTLCLPTSVEKIYSSAYYGNVQMKSVYIKNNIKLIGDCCFYGNENLSELIFDDYSLTEIPYQAFMNCSALTKIVLPKGLKTIDDEAFKNCTNLAYVYIPESVTSISENTFSYKFKTVLYGKPGSYAESFANANGFTFVALNIPAEGIAPIEEMEEITVECREKIHMQFEIYPENSTDVISITCNDDVYNSISFHDIEIWDAGDYTLTAKASSGAECEFTVHVVTADSLEVTKMPNKNKFSVYDKEFDLTGMEVKVNYSDESSKIVNDYRVIDTVINDNETATLTIAWKCCADYDVTTEIVVDVYDPIAKLTGIELTSLPEKLTYEKRESLNLTGIIVTGIYNDDTTEILTDYSVSGYNALKVGKQTITITYGNFSKTFEVEVLNIVLSEILINSLPTKTVYEIGDTFDTTGLVINLVYSDDSQKIVDSGFTVSVPDMSTVGVKTLTVTYGGKITTFDVTVNEKQIVSSHAPGDINGDDNVNNKDLTRLMKYLAGEEVTVVTEALDVNGDGNVNNKDLTRLMKYLAGDNVEIY